MAIRIKTISSEANDGTLDFLEVILKQTGKRAMAGGARRMGIEAERIQKRAIEQAPVDTHGLEDAIKIDKNLNDDRRVEYSVYVDGDMLAPDGTPIRDYALEMHESRSYKLGKKSQEKADALSVIVGPKYLERAADLAKERVNESVFNEIKGIIN